MFVHRIGWIKGLPALAFTVAAIAVAGCGGGPGADDAPPPITGSDAVEDATADADPEDLQVIEDWSVTLSEGDVEGAAGYFAIPSTATNGFPLEIRSADDAITFNDSLPCGAELVSAETSGDVTTATFTLSDRPGGDCGGGIGGQAATEFRIEDGKIVEWERVGVPGGGDAPEPPAPGNPV